MNASLQSKPDVILLHPRTGVPYFPQVYTAMRSGMVAALDARTGAFLALVPEPSCIVTPLTTQGVSGTLFFGTQEATGRQSTGGKVQLQVKDDGCMQSVVVGGTRALGLGVDHRLNAGAGNTALTGK